MTTWAEWSAQQQAKVDAHGPAIAAAVKRYNELPPAPNGAGTSVGAYGITQGKEAADPYAAERASLYAQLDQAGLISHVKGDWFGNAVGGALNTIVEKGVPIAVVGGITAGAATAFGAGAAAGGGATAGEAAAASDLGMLGATSSGVSGGTGAVGTGAAVGTANATGTGAGIGSGSSVSPAATGAGTATKAVSIAKMIGDYGSTAMTIGSLLAGGNAGNVEIPAPDQTAPPSTQSAKDPDYAGIRKKVPGGLSSGNLSTLLTGSSGIDPSTLLLGKSLLLGN